MKRKRCSGCKKTKTIDAFYKHKKTKDGLQHYCKDCLSERQKKRWSHSDNIMKNKREEYHLMKTYGLSMKDWNNLFKEQKGCCKICGKHQSEINKKLGVDHNHETGKVRGLLCTFCNTFLGLLEKNEDNLDVYFNYLKKNN